MDQILQDLEGVIAYFDDIVVHGSTLSECKKNLLACLQRLQENNLQLKLEKCAFFQTKIKYLERIIEYQKISNDPSKIEAIVNAPRPKNADEVQHLMGLIAHYSSFVPNVSDLTAPIRKLLQKDKKFHWSAECEAAFLKLKNILSSNQTLVPFDPDLPLIVATDASPEGQ